MKIKKIKLNIEIHIYSWEQNKMKEEIYHEFPKYKKKKRLKDLKEELIEKYGYKKGHCLVMDNFAEILWGKFFKFHMEPNNLIDESKIEEYDLESLNEEFEIEKSTIKIDINPPVGACVGLYKGIHFFFHPNEKDLHHRPHIHVKSEGIEFRVDLETFEILDEKTFKNKEKTKKAIELIKKNQEGLLNYWNKVVVKGESVKFKMFYPYK